MPERIQRQRTKGWRMPVGAMYVGRPSRWGNPYREGDGFLPFYPALTAHLTVVLYLGHLKLELARNPDLIVPLRGHDLACWCARDKPCHADVLLELANA